MLAAIDVKWLVSNPILRWLFNLKEARLGDQVTLDLAKPIPLWLLMLIVATVVFFIGLVYYKESRNAGTTSKLFMAGMRSVVALLALIIWMEPVVKSENTNLFRKVILVMVDTTGSMSTEDRNYDDDTVGAIAAGLYNLNGQDARKLKRIDIVKDYLENPHIAFLKRLQEKGLVKIVTLDSESKIKYDEPKVFKEPAEGQRFGDVNNDAVAAIQAKSLQTDLPQAVSDMLARSASEASLAGVILISDGRSTALSAEEATAIKAVAARLIQETVSKAGIPIFCVNIGSPHPPRNVVAVSIEGPAKITKDSTATLDVYFRYEGYDTAGDVTIRLEKEDLDAKDPAEQGWKDTGQKAVMKLEPGRNGQKIRVYPPFKFKPELQPGQREAHYKFRAVIESLKDEVDAPTPEQPVDVDNITDPPHYLDVTDRRLNVLYVEGAPRWEYRYLKNVLIRKKDEMVVWCLLLSADKDFPQEHTQGTYLDEQGNEQPIKPIQRFPDREGLKKFDVIIWGDVDPSINNYGIDRDAFENLRDFVQGPQPGKPDDGLGGGGLICILGESFFPRAYSEGDSAALASILPFKIEVPQDDEMYKDRTESFKFQLTDFGKTSELFRFAENMEENAKYWVEGGINQAEYGLPGVFWYWPIETDPRQSLGARVYVRHQQKASEEEESKRSATYTPVTYALFFEKPVGKGTVFVSAVDETWRWRYQCGDEPYFAPFWIRIIKHVAENRLQSETKWYIHTDPKYAVKDLGNSNPIKVEVKVPPEFAKTMGKDEKLRVWYQRRGEGTKVEPLELQRVAEDSNIFNGELPVQEVELPPDASSAEFDVWIDDNVAKSMGAPQPQNAADHAVKNFFVVRIEDREHSNTTSDPAFLKALALNSYLAQENIKESKTVDTAYQLKPDNMGETQWLFPIWAIGEIPDRIQGGDVPIVVSIVPNWIWASYGMFFLILVLLSVEWIVRKARKLI